MAFSGTPLVLSDESLTRAAADPQKKGLQWAIMQQSYVLY